MFLARGTYHENRRMIEYSLEFWRYVSTTDRKSIERSESFPFAIILNSEIAAYAAVKSTTDAVDEILGLCPRVK